ncbi:MAG: hypothetical protein OXI70_05140 [Chloroflexota bacterium]|nr:hypothetical protein [Chloroflexota bacterium]
MNAPDHDETIATDQEPADDHLKAEDVALAHAIAQGLSTKPGTKQQVLVALQDQSPHPRRAGPRTPTN